MHFKISSLITAIVLIGSSLPVHAEEHPPWIDRSVLATDHQAYCNDMLGQQAHNNSRTYGQNDIGSIGLSNSLSQQQESSRNSQVGGGGGIGLGPIGINGNGHSNNSSSNRASSSSSNQFNQGWNRSSQGSYNRDSVTTESVGKDCSAFVQAGALVEAAQMNAETQRMGIQSQETMSLFQGLLSNPFGH